MTTRPRILIACIGNIFLGDDAFGVEVARRLMSNEFPDAVRVADFGIRGLDLVYALMDGWDLAILVDAIPRGEAPGTLFVIEPEMPDEGEVDLLEAHSMDPAKVLRTVQAMGGQLGRVLVVGCEPTPIDSAQDIQIELSLPVAAAIEPAIEIIRSLIDQHLKQHETQEAPHAEISA